MQNIIAKLKRKRLSRKTFLSLAILTGIMAAVSCAPGTPQPRGWSGVVTAENQLFLGSMDGRIVQVDVTTGARLWAAPLGTERQDSSGGGGFGCAAPTPINAIYGTPAVNGDMVYVGAYVQEGNQSRGRVVGFTVGRDEPRWLYPRDGYLSGPVVGGLVVNDGKVYFGAADGKVYALDAVDGHRIAEFQTGDRIWSTPAIVNGVVYVGSFDKKLYALDANTLQPVKWQSFATEGAVAATPLVEQDTVYVGSFDRYLYALNATSGTPKWKFLAGNWFWAQPVSYNGSIYAPSLDGKMYVLDAATGAERAPALDFGSPISSSPVRAENRIILATEQGKLYGVDATSNSVAEITDLAQEIFAPLSYRAGTVFVHTNRDSLIAIDINTGAKREYLFK